MTQTIEELLSFIRLQAVLGVELDRQCPPIEAAHDTILAAFDALTKRITELEAQLQSFRDFNAPLLRVAAEEDAPSWENGLDYDDEYTNERRATEHEVQRRSVMLGIGLADEETTDELETS